MSDPAAQGSAAWGFEPARLERFLRDRLPDLRGPMQLEPIGGGQSNPTFFVSFDNRRLVLRKKPAGPVLPSARRRAMCPPSSVATPAES